MTEPWNVLLVDDSSTIRVFLSHVLHRAGYQVTAAENCMQALRFFSQQRHNAVVVDAALPDGPGSALINSIRAYKAGPQPYVLFYSGQPTNRLRQLVHHSGADGFVCKSSDPSALLNTLERARLDRTKNLSKR